MTIALVVDEGPQYTLETISIEGNTAYADDELYEILRSKSGEIFNQALVDAETGALRDLYFDSGYISARVNRSITSNSENRTASVVYATGMQT